MIDGERPRTNLRGKVRADTFAFLPHSASGTPSLMCGRRSWNRAIAASRSSSVRATRLSD